MDPHRKPFIDAELFKGVGIGVIAGAAVLALVLPQLRKPKVASPPAVVVQAPVEQAPVVQPVPAQPRRPDFGTATATSDARRLAQWVVASADNGSLPFAILDKKDARVFVFAPGGKLVGASPVLLGAAAGDDTVPGIGQRPIAQVRPEERTTPAGRFVAEPGRNLRNEDVIWVDYDAAVSMHRVLLTNPAERRAERLATPTPADNRISYGCINVPVSFFEQVLLPTLRPQKSVIYVMPETRRLEQTFPAVPVGQQATPA